VLPDSVWHPDIVETVALVPVRLIVCGLLAPLLFTVSVAASFDPAPWLGVNLKTIVQLDPLAITEPFEHVPEPVLTKSPAFPPVIVKYGLPKLRFPAPVQPATFGVAQLFTETVKGAEVLLAPCFPKVNVGGCAQFALFPVCPLFGQSMTVALPPPPAEAIPMLRFAVSACAGALESATRTVNETVPAAVGVPVIWPAALRFNPAGNDPADKDQLYGVVPPLAARVAEYPLFTCPPGSDEVVMLTGGTTAATAMLRLAVAVLAGALESATRTVNETVPAAVGVPVIWPAALRLNPAGNDPPDKDQLYGVVPPAAARVDE
jgi:hypothetical protein